MAINPLRKALRQIDHDKPTTAELGRDLTVELARLALAVRIDEHNGPVEDHHRWRLTSLGERVLEGK
jgi:hypothetical protein